MPGSVWWLSGIDNFTAKEQVAAGLACWGLFLGLFPPVFLTDEVEAMERRDALYGGSVSVVFLVLPLLVVPIATGTAISAWTDRALDSQRLNLREERVPVREAAARVADDYRQRGVNGPDLVVDDRDRVGAFARAESVARGFQDGLKFLSLTMLGLGLPLAALRVFTPPRQQLIADPVPSAAPTPTDEGTIFRRPGVNLGGPGSKITGHSRADHSRRSLAS